MEIIGKDYDVNGKQTMWWSQKILNEYVSRAQCFIKEYDQYMLAKNVYVSIYHVVPANMIHFFDEFLNKFIFLPNRKKSLAVAILQNFRVLTKSTVFMIRYFVLNTYKIFTDYFFFFFFGLVEKKMNFF